MSEIHVVPEGHLWLVKRNGVTQEPTHRLKRRALDHAYRVAKSGDTLVVHDRTGRVMDRRRTR